MNLTDALPTFTIALREGVEVALVVGIVLAYLQKVQRQDLYRAVFQGIGAGILASCLIAAGFYWGLAEISLSSPLVKQLVETGICILAIAMLSWMLLWMTRQGKKIKGEIESNLDLALAAPDHPTQGNNAAGAIFSLIALATLREGFEVVLFIAARFEQSYMAALGAISGFAGAVVFAIALFKFGVRINIRLFFQTVGTLLLLIVAGLVISALGHFDKAVAIAAQSSPSLAQICFAKDSCILGDLIWDLRAILPAKQFPGVILHTLLGYRDQLLWGQAIVYVFFLVTVGGAYWRSFSDRLNSTRSASSTKSTIATKTIPSSPSGSSN
ncbi:iron permease FTR1 [Thalassoporum mexicanum PCC 7367]|uniref:FTR1 family iron permease n=1 Tax=Thalassoporum mexicanum TaxID=3457544 RepID=UPI00029FD670|nr:FTR1 family protein [Pseudanabaena sp. PCC 7367]AFY70759.1 iron permease FTR1 [Pseudanabaena sp. PCC 7367]